MDSYIHMGGKVGVLMRGRGRDQRRRQGSHPRRSALQIAAASPVAPEYVRREEVEPRAPRAREGNPHRPGPQRGQAREDHREDGSGPHQQVLSRKSALLEQAFVKDADQSACGKMIEREGQGPATSCASPATRWATVSRRRSTTWPPKLPSRSAQDEVKNFNIKGRRKRSLFSGKMEERNACTSALFSN